MKSLLWTAFLLTLSQVLFSQNIDQKLMTHQSTYHLEKTYISHNQPYYAPRDTLFGKVYLLNGRSHQYFKGSPIVYLDWVSENGTIQASYLLKIENGTATISIPIKPAYGTGHFFLRAYTQYQKNFEEAYIFQKEIKVIAEKPLATKKEFDEKNDFTLQFFPEGGELVNGLTSTLAYKATNGKGNPITVSGVILNKQQEKVGHIKTLHEGIGTLNFKPEKGQTYQAIVSWEGRTKTVNLPKSLSGGYVLKVNNRKKEIITLQLSASTDLDLVGCTLVGHLRGQPFLNLTFDKEIAQKLTVDKNEIPSGVLHFTLFDAQNRPVCERLIFNNNPQEAVALSLSLPKTNYAVRELVTGEIVGKIGAKTAKGDFTITVYNKALFPNSTSDVNIKNYLLLQSDLKGHIRNINQYFETVDATSRTLLDYVLLTQGWRRFNWQDILEDRQMPVVYPPQERLSIAGKIRKDNNRNTPIKGEVFLSILDKENFTTTNLVTEEDGLFHFKGFDLPDSMEILLQGNVYNDKKKGKLKKGELKRTGNKNIKFDLLKLHELPFNQTISLRSCTEDKPAQAIFAKAIHQIRKIDTIYHPEWLINLNAVTVKTQRMSPTMLRDQQTKKMFKSRGIYYSDISKKIYLEDLPAGGAIYFNIFDILQSRIPGSEIVTTPEGKRIRLRSVLGFAAIQLDGVTISASTAMSINPAIIELIEVKKYASETVIYGDAGANGVITIITKTPGENAREIKTPGILRINHPGYHKARTFYTPNYAAAAKIEKPDYRTTLYWNPDLSLSKKPTPFQFFTGDKRAEFLIFIEGITEEGIPFVEQKVITVGR